MYIKRIRTWIAGIVVLMFAECVVMYLNRGRTEDIVYAISISGYIICLFFIMDYVHYRRKCKQLAQIGKNIRLSMEEMLDIEDGIEQLYSDMVNNLNNRMDTELYQVQKNNAEMLKYYSVWVHQIKTPISAMHFLMQDMEYDTKELESELFEIEQYVEMALQYVRMNSDSTDYVIENQKLDGIVREAVRKYAKIFIHKKISLNYDGVDDMVVTDKKWLGFVIGQLLSNALKYTKRGGVISIYTKSGELIIEDTGIGIAKEDIPRVFEKGYTGYNGHDSRYSSGIGLYLSREILGKLSHTISIESEVGIGTKVKIGFS